MKCLECYLWNEMLAECTLHDMSDEVFFKTCPNAPKTAEEIAAFDNDRWELADDEEKETADDE